ncbi:MAG TPA: hypothetical protein DG761_08840 [Gammaproteobacteria bacterium]|nr:hypothetical protein [Gammaproteobacteria bacterium]
MGIGYHLTISKVSVGMYTEATLKRFCELAGMAEVTEEAADVLLISLCDPDDLPSLVALRKRWPQKMIIAGGFEGYFANPYLAWADCFVVGEGFRFLKTLGWSKDDALALPNVLHNHKQDVVPDYHVEWDAMPLVKMPKGTRYYYLGAKGCKRKCKFCATSWCMPHQLNDARKLRSVTRYVQQDRKKLTIISNDAEDNEAVTASKSVRIQDYIKAPERNKASMLHFGVEGWTEAGRRSMGKPISDEELALAIQLTKKHKQQVQLFLIAGYPGWQPADIDTFIYALPPGLELYPRMLVKITYFESNPHAPWGDEPINQTYVDRDDFFRRANDQNKRVRSFPFRSTARAAWRSVLRRCTPEEALRLGPQPKGKNQPGEFELFCEHLESQGLTELLTRRGACSNIKTSTRLGKQDEETAET